MTRLDVIRISYRPWLLLLLWLPYSISNLCVADAVGSDRKIAQFVHKSWDAKSGAPPNITAITQTKDGYLWLASSKGLYRFDGMEFERFEPAGETPTSGPVYSLLSTANGDLWVGSAAMGIGVVRNGKSRNYTTPDGLPEGAVLSMIETQDGLIWAATQGGLVNFDGKSWRRMGTESGLRGAPPVNLFKDSSGNLFATNPDSIFELAKGAHKFRQTAAKTFWVMDMVESAGGAIWMAETAGAVRRMYPAGGPRIDYGSQKIMFDRDDSLWITTLGDGVRRVPNTGELPASKIEKSSQLLDGFTAKDGLSSDYVTSIYQDREGNIFIGTAGGMDRFSKGAIVPAPVPGKFIRSTIAPDEHGGVWLGCLSSDLGLVQDNKWYPRMNGFPAFSSASDLKGGTWWSTYYGIWHEVDGRFQSIKFPPAYKWNAEPTRIAVDISGTVWVSGAFGILRRSGNGWNLVDWPPDFPGKNASVAYADPRGRIWFGYRENSILLFDGSSHQVLSAKNGLHVGAVEAILANGLVTWIAGSSGLQLYDGTRFRDIKPAGGSSWASVSGVVEASGSLWLNTSDGVVQIKPDALSTLKAGSNTVEYTRFDAYDGLPGATQQSQPFPTLIRAKDGKVWFGASDRPAWIDPNDLPHNRIAPSVLIRSITANRKQYTSIADLRLPALTRDLEFKYTALSFTIPERVRFRYKLEGSDSIWQEAGTRRSAFYTNLPPGQYRFRVKACNNDGVWNESGDSVTFSIDPAFYETIWFRLTSLLAVAVLLWFVYRLRLTQATAQMRTRMEGRVAERTRIARELHDTLLQNLAGVSLQLDGISKQVISTPQSAGSMIRHVREQVDECFREARLKVWNLRSPSVEGQGLPAALGEFVDRIRPATTARCELNIVGRPRPLPPDIEEELLRIAEEATHNAVKHAQPNEIQIVVEYGVRSLRLQVRDDGNGFDFEEGFRKSGHFGLKSMRERAAQIRAKYSIRSAAGCGTQIEVLVQPSLWFLRRTGVSRSN